MKNHGNYVASLSQLTRWLAEQAEEAGATILPETVAEKLLVKDGRVVGVRTGDKGRGRFGERLPNFEPGSDILARVTILCEGTQGHLTGVAIDTFGLEGESPQVWALGVKEVWKVAQAAAARRAHDGLAAAPAGEVPRVRRLLHLPDGRRHAHDRDGRRARLPRRGSVRPRPAPAVEDESVRAQDARRRRAHRLGCEDDPRGWLRRAAEPLARARAPHVRRRGGAGERARAQGDPLRRRVGPPGGGGCGRRAGTRADAVDARSARRLRRRRPRELHLERPQGGPQHAPGVRPRLLHGRRPRRRDDRQQGQAPSRRPSDRARRPRSGRPHGPASELPGPGRQAHLRQALERLSLRQPHARRRAEPPPRADGCPGGDRGHVGADVPGPRVRGRGTATSRSRRRTASSAARSPRRAAA